MLSDDSFESDEYIESKSRRARVRKTSKTKRRKTTNRQSLNEDPLPHASFQALLENVEELGDEDLLKSDTSFENFVDKLLPSYLQTRNSLLVKDAEKDDSGKILRPLTRSEIISVIESVSLDSRFLSVPEAIALRKLKLERERWKVFQRGGKIQTSPGILQDVIQSSSKPPPDIETLNALVRIRNTPYENSFLSRLHGTRPAEIPGLIAVDWDTETPWTRLMSDIREHHALLHPNRDQPMEISAPITYTSLRPEQLDQIHDILGRSFWTGINVSDSLDYSPEQCTVIASYKKLVVGVAILSSPRETYITYLAVRSGWDNSRIATFMLYHLITLNPGKDITLHVSANNPAMLLYNRFGFKAEEFIAGFYDAYLDPQSRASKNAIRLRLRHH